MHSYRSKNTSNDNANHRQPTGRTPPTQRTRSTPQAIESSSTRFGRTQTIAIVTTRAETWLNRSGTPRRKQHRNVIGALNVYLLRSQKRILEHIARRAIAPLLNPVGNRDGEVKNGIVIFPVEPEVLTD